MTKKKKTRKEIGWLCFECAHKGVTYGINLTCGKCQSKYDNLELSSGSYAQCEKRFDHSVITIEMNYLPLQTLEPFENKIGYTNYIHHTNSLS